MNKHPMQNVDVCERCGAELGMSRDAQSSRRRRGRWLCRPCGQSESGSVAPDWSSLVAVEGEPRTLREIASQLGVTVEAVRHVEQRALARLRVRLEALGLKAADVLAYLDGLAVGRESCEPAPCEGGITRRGWSCPVCGKAMSGAQAAECGRCRVVVTPRPRYAETKHEAEGVDDAAE